MFDIGWGEFLVIGIVALIAIGPKELPGVLRSLGQWMAKLRRMASDFQGQFQEAMREAEMHDLKKEVEKLGDSARSYDPFADDPDGVKVMMQPLPPVESAPVPPPAVAEAQPAPAPALPEPEIAPPKAGEGRSS